MNKKELVQSLKALLQQYSDIKTALEEAQEDLRETIAEIQLAEVETI